jgi:hypothetical protein
MGSRGLFALTSLVLLASVGCGDGGAGGNGAGGSTSNGFGGIGEVFCGDESHSPIRTRPLVYLVLDASGSMNIQSGTYTRYEHVVRSVVDFVEELANSIRIGLHIFPGGGDDMCAAGREVYPPGVPDLVDFKFSFPTSGFGGTPTAASLQRVRADLEGVEGPAAVLLLTDGAPNCNFDATCTEGSCTANIEPDLCALFNCCGTNCCDPDIYGPDAPGNCVDTNASLQAAAELAGAGIPVYVVGIPGTEAYATVLDLLAVAGGRPQMGASTQYYRVSEFDSLTTVFKTIVAELIECRIELTTSPEAPDRTNVYLDQDVVLFDPNDGWQWESDAHDAIVFFGEACSTIKGGRVATIQVLSGCPTETPQ